MPRPGLLPRLLQALANAVHAFARALERWAGTSRPAAEAAPGVPFLRPQPFAESAPAGSPDPEPAPDDAVPAPRVRRARPGLSFWRGGRRKALARPPGGPRRRAAARAPEPSTAPELSPGPAEAPAEAPLTAWPWRRLDPARHLAEPRSAPIALPMQQPLPCPEPPQPADSAEAAHGLRPAERAVFVDPDDGRSAELAPPGEDEPLDPPANEIARHIRQEEGGRNG